MDLTPDGPEPSPDAHSAGPFSLVRVISSGGFGEVWEAWRREGPEDERVAVKFCAYTSPQSLVQSRAEVAALRWIDHPGVVKVHEEGVAGSVYWFAMQLVEGSPFPTAPLPWRELAPLAMQLFEALAEVHRVDIIHADIKPDNIRVQPSGHLVLLDFGISGGRALGKDPRGHGTPGWRAPELAPGQDIRRAADLYAAGRVLKDCLDPSAPPHAIDLIERLLDPDPAKRPRAEAFLRELRGDAEEGPIPEPLELLFAGPSIFFHLPERASEVLRRRTAGEEELRQELGRWRRWRVLSPAEGGLLKVDPARLEWLIWEEQDRSLVELVAAKDWRRLVDRTLRLAEEVMEEGQPERALALLNRVTLLPLDWRAAEAERTATLIALAATRLERVKVINPAICMIRRLPDSAAVREIDQLLQCSILVLEGTIDNVTLSEQIGDTPRGSSDLDICHQSLHIMTLLRRGPEGWTQIEERIERLDDWTRDEEKRAVLLRWKAQVSYMRGDYAGCADLNESAMALLSRPDAQLYAARAAAAAHLEGPHPQLAYQIAQGAAAQARVLRQPMLEARCIAIQRYSLIRAGLRMPPQPELVEVASIVSRSTLADLAFTEAVLAARSDRTDLAIRLARLASREFFALRHRSPGMLSLCLAASLGDTESRGAIEQLSELALGEGAVDIAVQIAVLCNELSLKCHSLVVQGLPALLQREPKQVTDRWLELMPERDAWIRVRSIPQASLSKDNALAPPQTLTSHQPLGEGVITMIHPSNLAGRPSRFACPPPQMDTGTLNIANPGTMEGIGREYTWPPFAGAQFAAPGTWTERWVVFQESRTAPGQGMILSETANSAPPTWNPTLIAALKAEFPGGNGGPDWHNFWTTEMTMQYVAFPPTAGIIGLQSGASSTLFEVYNLFGNTPPVLAGLMWRQQLSARHHLDQWRLFFSYVPPTLANGNRSTSGVQVELRPLPSTDPRYGNPAAFLTPSPVPYPNPPPPGASDWYVSMDYTWVAFT